MVVLMSIMWGLITDISNIKKEQMYVKKKESNVMKESSEIKCSNEEEDSTVKERNRKRRIMQY